MNKKNAAEDPFDLFLSLVNYRFDTSTIEIETVIKLKSM